MQNYFELFDLETSFFIDDVALKASYRKEVSRFHPDQFANKSESEKLQALQNTSLLNSAFKALKTTLNRAEYLLKLEGVDPFDEKDTSMDESFLLSQIDLREELESIEEKKDSLRLDDFIERINLQIKDKSESIYSAFKKKSSLIVIKKDVRELKFFDQLFNQANSLMDQWL